MGRRRALGPDPRSEWNDPPNSQDTETWDDERSRSRSRERRDLRLDFDGAAELDKWPNDGEDRDRRADESSVKWHRWTFLTTGGRSRLARRREGIINGEPGRRHEADRSN